MFREFVKNGLSDGFGVDPIDRLSMSGPESSPSPHDNDSNSWNSASNSRSPRNAPPWPRVTLPSSSSGTLNRFSSATIFCLKFLCCNDNVYDHRQNVFVPQKTILHNLLDWFSNEILFPWDFRIHCRCQPDLHRVHRRPHRFPTDPIYCIFAYHAWRHSPVLHRNRSGQRCRSSLRPNWIRPPRLRRKIHWHDLSNDKKTFM